MEIDDKFTFFGQFNPIAGVTTLLAPSQFEHIADNHIVGPQIGLRWFCKAGRWTASSQGRFLAGANFRGIHQEGLLTPFILNSNLNDAPRGSFANSFVDEEFSPVGEVRFDLRFQATRDISLAVGYTGLMAGGIARASNTIDWVVPQMGVLDPGGGEDLWVNGVNFGVEVNR
jgi:hypothetical protein